jgi:glucose-1-phosphate adenylyltransferase
LVCTDSPAGGDLSRFGVLKTDEDGRVVEFDEKPMATELNLVSCGIYVIRRRLLIEMLEQCAEEERHDFVQDILIRHRNVKKIYAYKMDGYWSNIASVDAYYQTNMDFLKKEVRDYFFHQEPEVHSKVDDNAPAKYNPGAKIRNSLICGGNIINGEIENSMLFKKVYVGNNCVIRNSIILNDIYIGDNTVIENCIVESRSNIEANSVYKGTPDDIKIVVAKKSQYKV